MIITYYGKQFFKLQLGDIVMAVNPVSKSSKLEGTRFGADICLISANHPDYNGGENMNYGDKVAFVINGPGEYEIKGISIFGVGVEVPFEKKKFVNTSYCLELDGIKLGILGVLPGKQAPGNVKETLSGVDILFAPVSLEGLSPRDAYALASSFEPKVIIPCDYTSETIKTFLKEAGADSSDKLDKLTVKRKDLEGKDGEVILLSPVS